MAAFLERYVRAPIEHLINDAPAQLPEISARMTGDAMYIALGGEEMRISRSKKVVATDEEHDAAPDEMFDGEP